MNVTVEPALENLYGYMPTHFRHAQHPRTDQSQSDVSISQEAEGQAAKANELKSSHFSLALSKTLSQELLDRLLG